MTVLDATPGALDAHIHLFQFGFDGNREEGAELTEFEILHEKHGIEGALVIGFEGHARFIGNNDYIANLAAVHPWVYPIFYLDSSCDPGPEALDLARARGFVGFSLYLDNPVATFDTWGKATLAALSRDSAIVSINASPSAIRRNTGALSRLTSASLLVSHLGLPREAALSEAEALDTLGPLLQLGLLSNVFVKISGLYAIDSDYPHSGTIPYVELLLRTFGANRLLWGSDYSPVAKFCRPDEYLSLPPWSRELIKGGDLEKVLGQNLRTLFQNLG
jgi:predicted TIM-barrel fold metal-dependent hydrolase